MHASLSTFEAKASESELTLYCTARALDPPPATDLSKRARRFSIVLHALMEAKGPPAVFRHLAFMTFQPRSAPEADSLMLPLS